MDKDEELILDREEYNMLKTLNTFVNIPGFSSRAMKIICEEELQVDDDETSTIPPSKTSDNDNDNNTIIAEEITEDIRTEDQKPRKASSRKSKKNNNNNSLFDFKVQTDAHKSYQYSKNRLQTKTTSYRKDRQLKTHDLTALTPRKKI